MTFLAREKPYNCSCVLRMGLALKGILFNCSEFIYERADTEESRDCRMGKVAEKEW